MQNAGAMLGALPHAMPRVQGLSSMSTSAPVSGASTETSGAMAATNASAPGATAYDLSDSKLAADAANADRAHSRDSARPSDTASSLVPNAPDEDHAQPARNGSAEPESADGASRCLQGLTAVNASRASEGGVPDAGASAMTSAASAPAPTDLPPQSSLETLAQPQSEQFGQQPTHHGFGASGSVAPWPTTKEPPPLRLDVAPNKGTQAVTPSSQVPPFLIGEGSFPAAPQGARAPFVEDATRSCRPQLPFHHPASGCWFTFLSSRT
eukprot:1195331-Pleurochrysis_carterae.AAC.3